MATNIEQQLQLAYLRWAAAAQVSDELLIERNRAFFYGEQGIKLTDRQREYLSDFGDDAERQALMNICRRAVEIPLERLSLDSVAPAQGSDTAFAEAVKMWLKSATTVDPTQREPLTQYDLYESALRDGVACLIIGWDGEKPTMTRNEIYDGKDGTIRLHYSPNDGSLAFASKRWNIVDPLRPNASGKARQTLYFAERIERYEQDMREASGWRLLAPEEIGDPGVTANPQPWVDARGEPLGIPVVPFWNAGGSELDDILMPQKGINKAMADLFTAADMHGFPMLALKGYQPTIGADGQAVPLKMGAGQALTLPVDGAADRIPGADLSPLFNVGVMGMIQLAAIIKGWPVYLFSRGEPPSGEALKVMESSLVAQVRRKQEMFEAAWRAVFELGRRMMGTFGRADLAGGLDFHWKDPQTRSEMDEKKSHLEVLAMELGIGVSEEQAQREYGYDEETIVRMKAETVVTGNANASQILTAFENRPPTNG